MSQNIYDDQVFFKKYMDLRQDRLCANNLEEKPARIDMIGDLKNKRVLDLGCGTGDDCFEYLKMGASKVVGIDVSDNMISEAKKRHGSTDIEFILMDMEKLSEIPYKFDVVVSSLAIHYIRDFSSLCNNVYNILDKSGIFLFSQEHPIFTADKRGVTWLKDIDDEVTGMIVADYPENGKRETHWLVDGVVKYHRTFSVIINSIVDAGLIIRKVKEPIVDDEIISISPSLSRCRHVPDYLYVLSEKE